MLGAPARIELARVAHARAVIEHGVPERADAVARERRIRDDRRRPRLRARGEDVERGPIFGRGRLGALDVVAVRLVDRDHVRDLDHALLQSLHLVASAGQHQHQEEVGHVGDHGLGLARADGLHQHGVIAGGLQDQHRLAGLGRDAAERPG